jgi:hypothetical protein
MNDDGRRGRERRRAGPADDADGDDEYGRGGGSGVYDVRGQLTRAREVKSDLRGRMSHDYHGRRVSPRSRSVEGASSVRLSGHLVNGDVADTDRAVIPTGDVGGEGKYHPDGNG